MSDDAGIDWHPHNDCSFGKCPNTDEIYNDGWKCCVCDEHGCEMCDDSKRFDDETYDHLCERCAKAR